MLERRQFQRKHVYELAVRDAFSQVKIAILPCGKVAISCVEDSDDQSLHAESYVESDAYEYSIPTVDANGPSADAVDAADAAAWTVSNGVGNGVGGVEAATAWDVDGTDVSDSEGEGVRGRGRKRMASMLGAAFDRLGSCETLWAATNVTVLDEDFSAIARAAQDCEGEEEEDSIF